MTASIPELGDLSGEAPPDALDGRELIPCNQRRELLPEVGDDLRASLKRADLERTFARELEQHRDVQKGTRNIGRVVHRWSMGSSGGSASIDRAVGELPVAQSAARDVALRGAL
jgi:hypothetical protein